MSQSCRYNSARHAFTFLEKAFQSAHTVAQRLRLRVEKFNRLMGSLLKLISMQ